MTHTASSVAQAVQSAFRSECAELGLGGRLDVDGDRLRPHFEPQFGASADWLDRTFREELASRGESAAADWCARDLGASELARLVDVVRMALRRTRARLVDTDSWVSGGLAWPFPVIDAGLRERGLALYRAPARAPATVTSIPGRVTIAFPAGDCGEIVSAGIWVPTLLAGDFDVAVSYELPEWIAGEREACLGLFAVASDGTFRMYAQRVTRAGESDRVVADIEGAAGPTVARCSGSSGWLRIARERGLLSAWHREHATWTWLGRIRETAPRPLLVGIKIWALGTCGPLRAELVEMQLEGAAAPDQTPPPPVRPDPRQGT